MTQKLEAQFSATMRQQNKWYLKLQCNPLAHHNLPGDFLVLTEQYRYLIEAKECKSIDGKGRFVLGRLSQLFSLTTFEKFSQFNKSFVLISFHTGRVRNNSIFFIPIQVWNSNISAFIKQSINEQEMLSMFGTYKIPVLQGGLLELNLE